MKLVAEGGVGTVAAGVAKAHADVVLISGHDGGTGASPLTSLKHAGLPWELGLAETQQVLRAQQAARPHRRAGRRPDEDRPRRRRSRALLGAEEFGFATAPLVVMGCVMMRVCHLNTCPVGIATQDPELRKKFTGKPEFVENFFRFIAEEVRELMAQLGFRTIDEMIGRADCLDVEPAVDHWKAQGLDLSPHPATSRICRPSVARRQVREQDHGLDEALDNELIARCRAGARARRRRSSSRVPIRNADRTVGTMLGYEVTKRYGGAGSARRHDPDHVHRLGGPELRRVRAARHHADARRRRQRLLRQGAVGRHADRVSAAASRRSCPKRTSSSATSRSTARRAARRYVRGVAGERFCVRNSGAHAVVEGVGDHGCEYMTGGRVVVLGTHRPQLRRRHERRHRLRARRGRRRSRAAATASMVDLERSIDADDVDARAQV